MLEQILEKKAFIKSCPRSRPFHVEKIPLTLSCLKILLNRIIHKGNLPTDCSVATAGEAFIIKQ